MQVIVKYIVNGQEFSYQVSLKVAAAICDSESACETLLRNAGIMPDSIIGVFVQIGGNMAGR